MRQAGVSAALAPTGGHPPGRWFLPSAAASVRLALVAAAIAVLEAACRVGWVGRATLVPPSEAAVRLWSLLRSGEAGQALAATLGHAGLALLLALAVGVPVGVALHALPRLRRALEPFLASYYAVPFFGFYPVLVALFGMNAAPIVAVGFLFAVLAVVMSALNGLDRIPPVLLKVARVGRMGRVSTALRIQLPAAMPHLFTGVRLAATYSLIGVIASEFLLSDRGLGYAVAYAYNDFDAPKMYALMLLLVLVVTGINLALHACERRLLQRREGR